MSPGDRTFWNLAHHAVNETRQLLTIAAHVRSKAGPDWSKHIRLCLDGPATPCGAKELERLPGSRSVARKLEATFGRDFERVGEQAALAHFLTCPISDIFTEPEVAREPPQAARHDPGRDFQFQHYAACHFADAGFEVSFEQEPDTQIKVPEIGLVGLAAERLKSIKKLRKNLKEAAGQIRGQELNGLIALDFTIPFDLHRKLFAVNSIEEAQAFHAALDLALRNGVGRDVARWVRTSSAGQAARAVIGYAAILVYVKPSQILVTAHQWYMGPVWAPDAIEWDFLRKATTARAVSD